MATHLARTCDATADSGYSKKWTWSGWVKRAKLGAEQGIMGNKRNDNNTNSRFKLYFRSTDKLGWECKDSGGSDDSSFETNALFRDVNCWYHITFIYDSDNSTATERIKCYVNGLDVRTEYGGFSSDNQASSGFGTLWSSDVANYLGTSGNNSGIAMQFEGCMSHCHLTYGYRYEASTFGSFDSTTGEWKINTSPSVTYGSQGYFLLKNDNSVTDQSGEGNNYTATGTLSKTEDNPSNVFATINNITYPSSQVTIAYGSTAKTNTPTSNQWRTFYGTIGASSGKYYFEMKVNNIENTDPNNFWVGIVDADQMYDDGGHHRSYQQSRGYQYHAQTGNQGNNNSTSSYGNSWTTNDIVGVAMDLDNSKLYFSKNGTWQNSGVPTSGSTGTGAISIASGYTYLPCFSQYYGNEWFSLNFGNGSFQGTAVSSAGTNASGNGIFEYDVPTGYTALSTKGLNL